MEAAGVAGGEGPAAEQKRKAWAKSRDSWQASDAERLSPEAPKMNPEREGGRSVCLSGAAPAPPAALKPRGQRPLGRLPRPLPCRRDP